MAGWKSRPGAAILGSRDSVSGGRGGIIRRFVARDGCGRPSSSRASPTLYERRFRVNGDLGAQTLSFLSSWETPNLIRPQNSSRLCVVSPSWIFFEVVLKVLAMVDAWKFVLGLIQKLLG